jgi:hypothetical protein
MTFVAGDIDIVIGELLDLRFRLLQTNNVGVLLGEPAESTFARGGANPIHIQRYDAHRSIIPMLRSL